MLRLLTISAVALLGLGTPAMAQGTQIQFGQSLNLSDRALEITSDSLEVDQSSGASIFSGNVVAAQGPMRLTAGSLQIEYSTDPETNRQRIDRLVADGGVTMVTETEAVEARRAVYSLTDQTLEMTGDVMLVQGPNVLAGERFFADLAAGTGQMTGRVRTVIRLD